MTDTLDPNRNSEMADDGVSAGTPRSTDRAEDPVHADDSPGVEEADSTDDLGETDGGPDTEATLLTLVPDGGDPVEPLDPERLRHRPVMTRLSWALVALAIAGGGFLAGAKVKEHNSSSGGSGLPGGFSLPAGFNPSALGSGGAFPASGGATTGTQTNTSTSASGAVTGTIVLINNGKVYIKDAEGKTTAIAIASGTTITLGTPGTVSSLKVGDEVIVAGVKDSQGVVGASAIATTGTAAPSSTASENATATSAAAPSSTAGATTPITNP